MLIRETELPNKNQVRFILSYLLSEICGSSFLHSSDLGVCFRAVVPEITKRCGSTREETGSGLK